MNTELTISISKNTIVSEIQNVTSKYGKVSATPENYEYIYNMQANDSDSDLMIIQSSIRESISNVIEILTPYILLRDSDDVFVEDKILLSLEFPESWTSNKSSLETNIYGYITSYVISDFLKFTRPDVSKEYMFKNKKYDYAILRIISSRKAGELRKPLQPF